MLMFYLRCWSYIPFMGIILQTVRHNAYDEDPYAKEFGIRISDKLASIEARILPPPWVTDYFILLSLVDLIVVVHVVMLVFN